MKEVVFTVQDVQELGDEFWDGDFAPDNQELCRLADIFTRFVDRKLRE